MNASELYEIVKDVPEAAKPQEIDFNEVSKSWYESGRCDGMSDALAEAAFVGSMVKHRLKNPSSSADIVHWSEGGCSVLGVTEKFPTLIAALAAACKEARP